MDHLAQHIESLIFTADTPIAFAEIRNCLQTSFDTKFKKPALEKIINQLIEKYQQEEYSFELVAIGGGYQFLTKAAYHNTVGVYLKQTTKKRLSKAALETLSIIAYKQPVTKSEMEKIRGVSCDYSVQKLLEKELVAILGRADGPGKPLLYGTSEKFMDYFGLKDIDALPKPKDFREPDSEIGEKAPIDEDAPISEDTPAIEASIPAPPQEASQEMLQELPSVDDLDTINEQDDIPQASDPSNEQEEIIPEFDEVQIDLPETADHLESEENTEPSETTEENQEETPLDSIEDQVYIPPSPDDAILPITEGTEIAKTTEEDQEETPIDSIEGQVYIPQSSNNTILPLTETPETIDDAQEDIIESETTDDDVQEKATSPETLEIENSKKEASNEPQELTTPTKNDVDNNNKGKVISILAPPLTPPTKSTEEKSTPQSTFPTSSLSEDIKETIQVITALPLNEDLLNLINKKQEEDTSKNNVVGDANSDE